MSLKMPFEMKNLTSFRMEKLCYDLRLEVLEEMDAEDTVELVKVNVGFYSMLSHKPWLVFDHHVYAIYLDQVEEIFLQKLPGSYLVKFAATHLPLVKRIRSCDELWIGSRQEKVADEFVTILNQLKSVKILKFHRKIRRCFGNIFENFHGKVEEYVRLPKARAFENQVARKLFDNFIVNQANDCEQFECDRWGLILFQRYYDAFAKTSIKLFMSIRIYVYPDEFKEMVQSIVKKPIPSKNLKAAVYLPAVYSKDVNARIVWFLSHFPGMKRINGESHQEYSKMASEVVKKYLGTIDFIDGLFFQRNIDSSRDCVYMLQSDPQEIERPTNFLAYYVQPQMEMM